jgi:hypothetical protein
MKPTEIVHKDIIGQEIQVGDAVVSPSGTNLRVGIVEKINPKMINVSIVGRRHSVDRRYPDDLLVIKDSKVTLYVLANSQK